MKKFETEVRLNREMSLMDVTLIGVGAMIGAGIFVLTGIAAGVAGPGLILAFLLNGVVTLFTAMAYAELGSCFHDAGGGYLWVKEGLPRWNGFLAGWMSWFAHAVACSLYALGFGAYFGYVLREFGIILPHWGVFSPEKILAAIIAFLFAYINFRGASETGKVGNLVTISKIVILMIFIGFGLNLLINRPDWKGAFTPFLPHGWDGIFKAMGLTFIAFEGYEVIAQCSEEIRSPRKNIPRAVFLSIAIVLPIYLLVGITALGSIKPENMTPWDYLALHKETALVELARQLFSGGGVMILVGGLISTMSALNATVFSSSRVAFAMGRDRNFPTFFSKVHSKNFTPHWAILVSSVIIVLMAVSLPIEDVASAADIMFLLLFLQVNIAMIRLRKKRPELDRGFSVPLFPGFSILGILMLLFLAVYMFNYSPMAWVVTVAWIVFGIGVYEVYASKREVEHIQKVKALERIERKEYRILVCLSNPQSVNSLTRIAIAVAKKHNAEIIFLHVIEVHEGEHLMAGLQETARAKPLFEEAESLASASGVPARSIIQVSHRISQGIVQTAAMEKCNFILIRRQKQPTFLDRVFSSLVDTVLQKSTSEVAVLHGEFEREKIRKILIPFGTSIHTQLATEIAPSLADYFEAELRIVVVFDPDISPIERDRRLSEVRQVIQENSLSAKLEMVIGKDILKGILEQAKDADLVLMGGRTGDFLELLFAKSLSQEITEQVKCPVLWVKEYQEPKSLWTTLLKPYDGGERMK
jgi:amino acid transporter/nucleotide-binding universal stress UspA family protein